MDLESNNLNKSLFANPSTFFFFKTLDLFLEYQLIQTTPLHTQKKKMLYQTGTKGPFS